MSRTVKPTRESGRRQPDGHGLRRPRGVGGATMGLLWIGVASLVVALSTSACSADSGDHSDEAVPAAFAAKAATVCAAASAQKDQQGPFPYPSFNPTDPDWAGSPGIADYLGKTPKLFRTWEEQMRALGTPSSGAQAWNDLVDAIHHHLVLAQDQAQAAVDHDSATFTDDYQSGRRTQEALKRAADAAGVPSCADPDR